ncbi:lipopolysaccharide-induced tumor necrosis factor-alpha factor homolog [Trichoplusia ni]|uniref:Lipopolysaccharide-induced tumor necrosis factor-alpha factor homolog n=1 Tax=Trichoplusia ni TaxID=7111 RepID=A0A7E5WSI2_TRINI|nr:lipopolysaccharide-induced tumor necrosis factor-alpha factor homolog [Trichoplusia ni]
MDTNNGVNPTESVPSSAVLSIQSETVTFHREPPPPYDSLDGTVTTQPIVQTIIIQPTLKNEPMYYICHKCEERVLTKVKYESTKKTHMLAGFVFGFTLWCSLCCLAAIPYLMKTFKKAHHYCPNCDSYLGAYSKI